MNLADRIYAFEDPVDFLNFELQDRQKKDPRFSLRAWSRQIGYRNPSYLSHVLNRKRKLKPAFAEKLASNLVLTGRPRKYFELMVFKQNASSSAENLTLHKLISSTRPVRFQSMNKISLETFSVVSEWYHWAILEMTELANFELTVANIHGRLGKKVSQKVIRAALDRLLRTGLLKRGDTGKLERVHKCRNETDAKIPQEAVASYFKQVSELAMTAMEKQKRSERDFYGTTLAFRKENYQRAIDIITEAHRQILLLAEHGTGEELYQFNTQFFRMTEPVSSDKAKKPARSKLQRSAH